MEKDSHNLMSGTERCSDIFTAGKTEGETGQ